MRCRQLKDAGKYGSCSCLSNYRSGTEECQSERQMFQGLYLSLSSSFPSLIPSISLKSGPTIGYFIKWLPCHDSVIDHRYQLSNSLIFQVCDCFNIAQNPTTEASTWIYQNVILAICCCCLNLLTKSSFLLRFFTFLQKCQKQTIMCSTFPQAFPAQGFWQDSLHLIYSHTDQLQHDNPRRLKRITLTISSKCNILLEALACVIDVTPNLHKPSARTPSHIKHTHHATS